MWGATRPPTPPSPLLKKAGENWLENFSGFATDYAGPPLIGSGGLVLFVGSRSGKGWRMDRLAGGRSQRPGGAAGAHSAHKAWAGTFCPAHALVLRAPWARKTPPPPGVTQRLPPPLRQRASVGHTAVGCGHRKEGADMRGAAAFLGPGPLAPALKTSPLPGKARQRAGGRSPPAAAPGPLRFPPTPKRQRKSQAPRSMGPGP